MRKVLNLLLILSFSSLFSQSQNNGYEIKGKIKGWHDTICYLGNYYGKLTPLKDSVRIDKSGNFVFKGKENLPGGIYLIIFPNKTNLQLVIDKEQNFSFTADTARLIESMTVIGSEENILFYENTNFISQKQKLIDVQKKRIEKIRKDSIIKPTSKRDSIKISKDKITAFEKEIENYKEGFIKEHPALFITTIFKTQKEPVIPETPILANGKTDSLFSYRYYKDHFWDNVSLSDGRLLRTPIFHMKLKQFFDNVVIQNPDSINKESDILIAKANENKEMFKYIISYMTQTYEKNTTMGMDAVFVHHIEKYYVTKKAFWMDSIRIQKPIYEGLKLKALLIGKPAPPITLQDTSDKNISLYDIKSKYTVLIFWDPDCNHCQKALPKLKQAYDTTLKAKGVEVFSVAIEENVKEWKNFILNNKLDWINTHDKYRQTSLRNLYNISNTPLVYLLDENKTIKAKKIDVIQIASYVDFLEKQNKVGKE